MKKTHTHTTKGVRAHLPIRVVTLTSESGTMRLTTTQGELWAYEHNNGGKAGQLEEMVSIPDELFGHMLQTMLEDGALEREWISE